MRPMTLCSPASAGAAVVAAAHVVVMAVIAAAVAVAAGVAAAAEDQQKNDDQPDAGTVVVEAHFVTSLVLHWAIICPQNAGGTLSGWPRGRKKKGTNYDVRS